MNNDKRADVSNEQSTVDPVDGFDWGTFKVQLNNVVMCYGPGNITLSQAEEAMLRLITYLGECRGSNNRVTK